MPFVGKKDGSYNYWASESRAPAFALHLTPRPREKQVSKPGPSNLIDGAKQAAKQGTDGYSLNMTFFSFLFAPSLLNSIPLPLPGRGCFCLSKLLSICSSPSWLPFPTWRRQVVVAIAQKECRNGRTTRRSRKNYLESRKMESISS